MAYENMDLTHLTPDEKINGIGSLKVPNYLRNKAHGQDVRETIAQLAEMIIQLGVNLRLDPDEALEWARKLQESVSQSEFDSWVATLLDGGPSLFFETKAALVAKHPNGAPGVALIRETDPAKIYVWNGSAWEDFGDYQGLEVKDQGITTNKLADAAVTPRTISSSLFEEFEGVKIVQQSATTQYLRLELVFDTENLNLSDSSPITVQFKFYSESSLINDLGTRLYLNNNRDSLGTAIAYTDLHTQTYQPNTIHSYHVTRDSYVSGNRYVHLFISLTPGVSNADIEFFLSNAEIEINGQKLKNLQVYNAYNGTVSSERVDSIPNQVASKEEFKALENTVKGISENRIKTYYKVGGEGDSNMYGRHADGTTRLSPTWMDMVANHFGATEVWNGGVSGCNISTSLYQGATRSPLVNRLNEIPLDCNLFFAEGGFNDYWTGTPKGTMGSRDTGDFYGALHTYYGHLAENMPFADIVVIGVWQSRIGTEFGGSRSDGTTLREWADIQKEVAEYYGLPFYDSYADFISVNVQTHIDNFSTDSLHLTEAGRNRFAKRAIGFVNSI